MRWMCLVASLLCGAFLVGCAPPAPPNQSDPGKKSDPADGATRAEIKAAFDALQVALDEKDADKIWSLLTQDSRDDAEREAKAVKEAFSKIADKKKPAFAKNIGLSAKEMTEITGKLYLKSNAFHTDKMEELSDCDVDEIAVAGESGVVHYTDEEDAKVKLAVVREQGQWRFAVPVAKAILK